MLINVPRWRTIITLYVFNLFGINAWIRATPLTAPKIEKIVVYFVVRARVIVVDPKPRPVVRDEEIASDFVVGWD